MKKSWGLIPRILSGAKTIESRWYMTRRKPWDSLQEGEWIYFKNSGEPVTAKTRVKKVIQYADLSPKKVVWLLKKYGRQDGLPPSEIPRYYEQFKHKKYCMMIFLGKPLKSKPFEIEKRGFGAMAAWITVEDIKSISI